MHRPAIYRTAAKHLGRALENLAEWIDSLAGKAYWQARQPEDR